MTIVRTALPEDLPLLGDVEREADMLFRTVDMDYVLDHKPRTVQSLYVYQQAGRAWVATDGNQFAGFLLLDVVGNAVHIEQVSVDPTYAHQQIGARLIDRAAGWGAQRGFRSMTLTTFAEVPWNAPYYRRLDFHIIPEAERSPELVAIGQHEVDIGLARWPRVVMCRPLGS